MKLFHSGLRNFERLLKMAFGLQSLETKVKRVCLTEFQECAHFQITMTLRIQAA